ncbi:MAG: hypothetical protein RLZZ252_575 [Bacteroidota bacterium]|jgi:hypothetical protein
MKRLLVFVLLVAVMLPSVLKLVTIISFYANRDYIAKELCVEKNNPNNCCLGSCQLQQKLAKIDFDKATTPLHHSSFPNLPVEDHWVLCMENSISVCSNQTYYHKINSSLSNMHPDDGYLHKLFQPPQFS